MSKLITAAVSMILLSVNCLAATDSNITKTDSTKPPTNIENSSQKTIDDFYAYAGRIKPEVREEIRKYRLKIVEINKEKRELYNKLSQEAQAFLAEEQKYKKKLSIFKQNSGDAKEESNTQGNLNKNQTKK
jgi:hypothetical protein